MSTFSSDIGPEEEDGAGWGGLVPTAEERRAEKREAQDKIDRDTGAAWRLNSSLEVWFPFTAEELVKLRQDKDRLEWDSSCRHWGRFRQRGPEVDGYCIGAYGRIGWARSD